MSSSSAYYASFGLQGRRWEEGRMQLGLLFSFLFSLSNRRYQAIDQHLPILVLQQITKAGGKKVSEVEPEGDSSLMQHFEDSEGNWVGLYTMKKT